MLLLRTHFGSDSCSGFREDVAPSADVVPLLFLKMLTRRGRVCPRRPVGADATAAHNDSHQCQCIKHRKQNIPVYPPFHRGNLINLTVQVPVPI